MLEIPKYTLTNFYIYDNLSNILPRKLGSRYLDNNNNNKEKYMKVKKISIVLFCCLLFNSQIITNASEISGENKIVTDLLDVQYYDKSNAFVSDGFNDNNKVVLTSKEAKTMTSEQIIETLRERTSLSTAGINNILNNIQEKKNTTGKMSTYSSPYYAYDEDTWTSNPYISKTEKKVTYTTSWLGIDAYRSSVGMTKMKTESISVTVGVGFSGSAKIKTANPSLSASYNHVNTTTVSESQTCPAWTTMNWRPYTVYYVDYYTGTYVTTTYLVYTDMSVEIVNRTTTTVTGTNTRLVTSTTELWSRYNSTFNLNLPTPLPPTGAPII
jgi:hypothetical protein